MAPMISSFIPFPPVSWWAYALQAGSVTFDAAEHYQKMSYRNRYYLAAPEGKLLMSLPLDRGRNQRIAVQEVQISDRTNWQDNHWKTIVSLYGNAPFFEHFEYRIRPAFEAPAGQLADWNRNSIILVDQLLGLGLQLATTTIYQHTYAGQTDLRTALLPQQALLSDMPPYYQVFADRCGFQPDCSILDLLFNEGPHARTYLKALPLENKA
ncbi:WbqC family protein [Taibaiella chishuiensis]|uniref:WbqC-like protein n=1 Tax=Taibaiella chishuiensis TaxID=1434707 RepID=A0A2P8D426_9BACT|nr:WbqC family protein [Taibaiella chishuiensis]PSK91965.1 WbqC-like protein [Taibaiella chishuiensis]